MNAQTQYEIIIECIKTGAPAIANELISSYNKTVQLANEQISYQEEMRQKEIAQKAEEAKNTKKETK